ncbi:MAG TPA: helix-turn-helix domain-containing protein [Microthrixaceae bacterium]|nr:helix-turn-helix domain-containing protein [Microthrixaceae bacterium]
MAPDRLQRNISGLASLDQPTRRALYDLVARRGDWTGRDAAAEELDLPRSVAAFHLDKLAEAGLVEVKFERPAGRGGPGAGRPAKLYRRSAEETAASVPDRRYDLAGSLLARAVATATRTGARVTECLAEVARTAGAEAGQGSRPDEAPGPDAAEPALLVALEEHGYEPVVQPDGEIALRNCPFHRLAQQERELVCGMNLDFLSGCLDGLGVGEGFDARLDPEPGYCCVRITRPEHAANP